MELTILGKTELKVPPVFIGTGSSDFKRGSKQEKIKPQDYLPILKKAYHFGINFWDTSDDYHTHSHLRLAMEGIKRENLIIGTKTHETTLRGALRVLDQSLFELGTSYVDCFYLHAVDSLEAFSKRTSDALKGLLQAKEDGKIRAIGLSTHNIHVLEKAVDHPELDLIFTNYNKFEVHMDASLEWYTRCLKRGYENGKGILVMKTLGEGRLKDQLQETFEFNLTRPFIHSVCIGIASLKELDELLSLPLVFQR